MKPAARPELSSQRHKAHGGILLEALVAMVILSLAALGSVAFQLRSLTQARQAIQMTAASAAAQELAGLMRNNPGQVSGYLRTATMLSDTSPAAASPNCISAKCTAGQLAAWEMADWMRRLHSRVPGAHLTVCRDSAPFASDNMPQWACTAPAAGASAPVWIKLAWPERITTHHESGASTSALKSDFGDGSDQLRPLIMLPVIVHGDPDL